MVDPGIHAEMTILIRREKELEEQIQDLQNEEIPLWTQRVGLAEEKGMGELADEARGRLRELQAKAQQAQAELDSIDMHKSMLRHESRRPGGQEVARAEALLEQVRLAGLVDPDQKDWDELEKQQSLKEESGAVFDFDEED
jgi:hypothetical protein